MVYALSIHIIAGTSAWVNVKRSRNTDKGGPIEFRIVTSMNALEEEDLWSPRKKLFSPLTLNISRRRRKLVMEFKDHVGMFKVGKQLFTHCGPKIVDFINMKNSRVFLDLKYHDIPNTVAKAVIEAAKLGVELVNVHASGGFTMMNEAKTALHDIVRSQGLHKPKIIGVTVLTSLDDEELKRIGFDDARSGAHKKARPPCAGCRS